MFELRQLNINPFKLVQMLETLQSYCGSSVVSGETFHRIRLVETLHCQPSTSPPPQTSSYEHDNLENDDDLENGDDHDNDGHKQTNTH